MNQSLASAPNRLLLACVHCKTPTLGRVVDDGIESYQCRKCSGRWFRRPQINRLIRRKSEFGQSLKGLVDAWREARGHHCPDCRKELREIRFSESLALVVKQCEPCGGVWIEEGQLPHLIHVDQAKHVAEAEDKKPDLLSWLFQFFFLVPLESNIKARKPPMLSMAMMLLCFGAFFLEHLFPAFGQQYALHVPFDGPLATTATLFTYQFLHGDLGHLAGNMYFLYILGRSVEDVLKGREYLAFYLLAGVFSALGFAFTTTGEAYLVGASGAISALLGFYVVVFRRAKMTVMLLVVQLKVSVYAYAAFFVFSNFLIAASMDESVAWQAHLFGFAAGWVVGKLAYKKIVERRPVLAYVNGPTT